MHQTHGGCNPVGLRCQIALLPPQKEVEKAHEVEEMAMVAVTVLSVTPARKVGLGLQDLQTRARRILAERNAKKAEENTWIGRMVAAESIGELDGLIKSRAA